VFDVSVPVGGACAMILSFIWVSPLLRQPDVPWDWVGVASYSLASLIELMAEPLWVLSQLTHHVSIKVVALGIPQILKCGLVAVGMAFYSYYGVLVFAVGQLAYSICYLLIYYVYFTYQIRKVDSKLPINSIFEVLPHSYNGKWLDGHLLGLSFSFFKQSFLKQLLTDGERYIMTLLGLLTFAEQGVYDIITNLGSLIARIVFLPIEESFYVYFASVLIRGDTALVQSKAVIQSTSRALSLILKLVSLIALVILVFGNSYSELALDIYGGQILSQGAGPILLRSFCVYLLFLAVNGMTECFMFSSMSQERVNRYNNVMVIFSITFLCAAALLIQIFGSVGFIFANCINMATRIVYSTRFIYNFYKPVSLNPLWDAVPSTQVWLSLLLSFMITVISMVSPSG
jgi:oligosaccharide translocation protein RFT1